MRTGNLIVFSGPSGVGKDTVLNRVVNQLDGVVVCITATTRPMRPGESPGNPYEFLSVEEFKAMVDRNAFLEYAHVNGKNLYGTPADWVAEKRAEGLDVILKIDVQGGLAVKQRCTDAILIFLEPPSLEELERRLRRRSTEDEDQIRIRLVDARKELAQRPNYHYAVLNDDLDQAADLTKSILLAERCRICA